MRNSKPYFGWSRVNIIYYFLFIRIYTNCDYKLLNNLFRERVRPFKKKKPSIVCIEFKCGGSSEVVVASSRRNVVSPGVNMVSPGGYVASLGFDLLSSVVNMINLTGNIVSLNNILMNIILLIYILTNIIPLSSVK